MTYSKIKTLNDVFIYAGNTAVPGVISFNEKSTADVYGIKSFGESRPTAFVPQNSKYTVKLEILDFAGLDELFGNAGFELRIENGQENNTYVNCTVYEIVKGTDKDNRVIAEVSITAENKIKDVS